jgi:threonine synthase
VLATAHPAKFPSVIAQALGMEITHPRLEELKAREVVKHLIPAEKDAIEAFILAGI